MYAAQPDGDLTVPGIPLNMLSEDKARQVVPYWTDYPVGTIIVDPYDRRLYHVRAGNTAMRYTVGVGAAGYLSWPAYLIHGTHDTRKIGRLSSDGCIGLYNEKIEELYAMCPIGTQVRII